MILQRASASTQRAWRMPSGGSPPGGSGSRGESDGLLACMQEQWSGARWYRAAPLNLHATEKGEHSMRYIRHISCIVAASLIVSMTLLGPAANAPAVERSRASAGPLHDPST